MLIKLLISDVAVISKAELNLDSGFNVLTGETGAGKSLLVDSLNLVLGERGSRELLRAGEKRAKVEALFCLNNNSKNAVQKVFGEFEGDDLVLSRELYEDGKNICKINGSLTTVSGLKEIGGLLVNIHGQHDGQRLLSKVSHREYVDAFAGNIEQIKCYKNIYSKIREAEAQLSEILLNESEKAKRLDILKYWADEIEKANLTVGEDVTLLEKRQIIRNSEQLKGAVLAAYNSLYGGDETVYSMLSIVIDEVKKAADIDSSLAAVLDGLTDALYKAEDSSRELAVYSEGLEFDPLELSLADDRLELIYKFKTKYGSTIEEIIKYGENARKEASEIEMSSERAAELEKNIEKLHIELTKASDELTNTRKEAATKMEKEVMKELAYLDMEKVIFNVHVGKTDIGPEGADNIEFLISTNPSEPLKPLIKIASGGEMSRICLAIKTVLADSDDVATMIFDEIDAGISGKAAEKAGRKMKQLGEDRQIICITHLPQIAALADSHHLIKKILLNDTFVTDVEVLDMQGRTKEVARIMSGENISENAIKTAREMIQNS